MASLEIIRLSRTVDDHARVGRLPTVDVDSCNVELRDAEGCVGDKANRRAFTTLVDESGAWLRRVGDDPLGNASSEAIKQKQLE